MDERNEQRIGSRLETIDQFQRRKHEELAADRRYLIVVRCTAAVIVVATLIIGAMLSR